MYKEPIFLQPIFKERIWGGKKLKSIFNYHFPSYQVGEAWIFAAHPNGTNIIQNGPLTGKTLDDAWKNHGELFNKDLTKHEEYPLLVKIIDANNNLSVQVHPGDRYAREIEGQPYGKTECWYVLNADPGAEIILGHHANSWDELVQMMEQGEWNKLLKRVKVKAGDFFYVPSGTIHAIGMGVVILEVQQNSDITYRVYDYDRTDEKGQKRVLHREKAKDILSIPHKDSNIIQKETVVGDLVIKQLLVQKYFSVFHWHLDGRVERKLIGDFLQVSVIEGEASLTVDGNVYSIKKGNNFIIPSTIREYVLSGGAEFIISSI